MVGWGWAYWGAVWVSWLLIPLSFLANHLFGDAPDGTDACGHAVGLFWLGLLAQTHWGTQMVHPLFWFLQAACGGPAMLLAKFFLDIGDATDPHSPPITYTSAKIRSIQNKPLRLIALVALFASGPALGHILSHLFFETLVLAGSVGWVGWWCLGSRILCGFLLLVSVLELNVAFNARFAAWLWRQRRPTPTHQRHPVFAKVAALSHVVTHIAFGLAILFIAIVTRSVAAPTALHILWLALDDA